VVVCFERDNETTIEGQVAGCTERDNETCLSLKCVEILFSKDVCSQGLLFLSSI